MNDITTLPVPEQRLRAQGIASRATFWRWGHEGLRVLKIGKRRFIYEADLKQFLEAKSASAYRQKPRKTSSYTYQ